MKHYFKFGKAYLQANGEGFVSISDEDYKNLTENWEFLKKTYGSKIHTSFWIRDKETKHIRDIDIKSNDDLYEIFGEEVDELSVDKPKTACHSITAGRFVDKEQTVFRTYHPLLTLHY